MTPEEKRKKIDNFIALLTLVREEATKLGLHLTGEKIHQAVKEVEWELENLITKGEVDKKSSF